MWMRNNLGPKKKEQEKIEKQKKEFFEKGGSIDTYPITQRTLKETSMREISESTYKRKKEDA